MPARHLAELEQRLQRWAVIAEEVVRGGGDVASLGVRLAALDDLEMKAAGVPDAQRSLYFKLCPMVENSTGLFRYVKRQAEAWSQPDDPVGGEEPQLHRRQFVERERRLERRRIAFELAAVMGGPRGELVGRRQLVGLEVDHHQPFALGVDEVGVPDQGADDLVIGRGRQQEGQLARHHQVRRARASRRRQSPPSMFDSTA